MRPGALAGKGASKPLADCLQRRVFKSSGLRRKPFVSSSGCASSSGNGGLPPLKETGLATWWQTGKSELSPDRMEGKSGARPGDAADAGIGQMRARDDPARFNRLMHQRKA
jgi:hypothetical protein